MSLPYAVAGISHRTWTAAVRDALALEEGPDGAAVGAEFWLPGLGLPGLGLPGLAQGLWLATCDRLELHAVIADPAEAEVLLPSLLAARVGIPPDVLGEQIYLHTGVAAVRHLFAVTASLDSQMIGDPQVLGQVKSAYRAAAAAGRTGPELDALLQAALAVAKRVRTETSLGERPTSLAAAAVEIARDLHGDLKDSAGLLLGLGDMGLVMAEHLRASGLGSLSVSAASELRAEAAARRLGGHYAPESDLLQLLSASDLVVTAVGLGRYTLSAELMREVLRRRRRRPVFVIDAALPTDVEPGAGDLDGVFVYDLADLERVALAGRGQREAAAVSAWALVDQALAAFLQRRAERAAVPALVALRQHFEAERQRVLSGVSEGSEAGAARAEEATRLLVNRLLHRPSAVLRALAAEDIAGGLATGGIERGVVEAMLRHLFGLDPDGDPVGDGGAQER